MTTPFTDQTLRDWFFDQFFVETDVLEAYRISTIGSGPFDKVEFDEFLASYDITISGLHAGIDMLVVGRHEWDQSAIEELLDQRAGQDLRVYSQEMFLSVLLSSTDPELWLFGAHEPDTFLRKRVGWPSLGRLTAPSSTSQPRTHLE